MQRCAEVIHGDILPENFPEEQLWESPGEVCVHTAEREGDTWGGGEEGREREGEGKIRRNKEGE